MLPARHAICCAYAVIFALIQYAKMLILYITLIAMLSLQISMPSAEAAVAASDAFIAMPPLLMLDYAIDTLPRAGTLPMMPLMHRNARTLMLSFAIAPCRLLRAAATPLSPFFAIFFHAFSPISLFAY